MNGSLEADKLLRLEGLVPLCDSIRKGSEYRNALAHASAEVRRAETLPERLRSLEPAIRVLAGMSRLPTSELDLERAALAETGRQLERCVDVATLRDAHYSVREAEGQVQRIEAMVTKAWASAIKSEFSPLERLGAVLSGIPDTRQAGSEFQKWAKGALLLADGRPPSAAVVEQFTSLRAELAQRLDELGKTGIGEDVRTFLIGVAGKVATLETLTPDTLAWLRAKKAQSRFRIDLI